MRAKLLAALAASLAVLAGCAAPSQPPGPGGQPAGPTEVKALGSECGQCFEPAKVTVEAGAKVHWADVSGSHTVTFKDPVDGGAAPDSGNLDPGQSYELTFPKAGVYEYRCRYHSSDFGEGKGMVGTVTVR